MTFVSFDQLSWGARLAQLREHAMNLTVGLGLLEFGHRLETGERPANQATEAYHLPVECHPVGFIGEQLFSGVLDFRMLVASVRHRDESPYSGGRDLESVGTVMAACSALMENCRGGIKGAWMQCYKCLHCIVFRVFLRS